MRDSPEAGLEEALACLSLSLRDYQQSPPRPSRASSEEEETEQPPPPPPLRCSPFLLPSCSPSPLPSPLCRRPSPLSRPPSGLSFTSLPPTLARPPSGLFSQRVLAERSFEGGAGRTHGGERRSLFSSHSSPSLGSSLSSIVSRGMD